MSLIYSFSSYLKTLLKPENLGFILYDVEKFNICCQLYNKYDLFQVMFAAKLFVLFVLFVLLVPFACDTTPISLFLP